MASGSYKVRDTYRLLAEKENVRARSYYKLQELDAKRNLIKPGQRILDLGAAPGSWTEYVLGKTKRNVQVVAIDKEQVRSFGTDKVVCVRADVFGLEPDELLALGSSGPKPFDVLLSDMAPRTTGVRLVDAEASFDLVVRAGELASSVLRTKGVFVAKLLQGPSVHGLLSRLGGDFASVSFHRPKATRKASTEIFLIGKKR